MYDRYQSPIEARRVFPDLVTDAQNERSPEEELEDRKRHVAETRALVDIPPGNTFFYSPGDVRTWLATECRLSPERRYAYMTGGFDCGAHHEYLLSSIGSPRWGFILGLEPKEYFDQKGVPMHFTLEERLQFWLRRCHPPTAVLLLPRNLSGADYDILAQKTGTWKNPMVVHGACVDDPPEILAAREGRAYSPDHFIRFAVQKIRGVFRLDAIINERIVHTSQLRDGFV